MKYNYQLHIVPTLRRTLWGINGNAGALPTEFPRRSVGAI